MVHSTPTVPRSSYLEDIGIAMGRIPSGVFVLTAVDHSRQKAGMLASWIMQTGFEPPSISVAVHPDREIYHIIQSTRRFTVNILSDNSTHLMKVFSRFSPDQFEQVACQDSSYGIILNDAVSALHCRLLDTCCSVDHHLLIAEVEGGLLLNPNAKPYTHLRKTGFSY